MLKAVIVDDEKSGREILASMLTKDFAARISISALCKNIDEAAEAIKIHSPDVIFLDIEMPNGTGFDLIDRLPNLKSSVVFVTAYNQHAVHAFRVNAIDYLLKPLQADELRQTIQKLEEIRAAGNPLTKEELLNRLSSEPSFHRQNKIGLPTPNGLIFVEVKNIIRCEADDNYTFIILPDRKFLVSRTLKEVEESLKEHNFFRVHKSHLVNLDKVIKYLKQEGGTLVLENNSEIPVGRQAKEELERKLLIL